MNRQYFYNMVVRNMYVYVFGERTTKSIVLATEIENA